MLLIPVSHTRSACFAHFHKMLLISQNAMDETNSGNNTFVETGGLNWLRIGKMTSYIEQQNALSDAIKSGEFRHQLSNCQPLNTDCAQWS